MFQLFIKITVLSFALFNLGCGSEGSTTPAGNETATTGSCQLLENLGDCPSCWSGVVTCTYLEISVTEDSCFQCQAQAALYVQLCNSGNTDTVEELENGIECTEPEQ